MSKDIAMASEQGRWISSGTVFNLSEEEVSHLKSEVENSDNFDAAFRLYQYYNFSRYDRKEVYKYLLICAQNGNATAQLNLAAMYCDDEEFDKAREWAIKAKRNGEERAANSWLQEIAAAKRRKARESKTR